MESEAAGIREELGSHHDGKFGFVVYRCVYGDDEQWTRFMQRLIAYTKTGFRENEDGETIKDHFVLDVCDNEEKLRGASKERVRKLFNEWVETVEGIKTLTRYTSCIYVDEEVLNAVLDGEDPNSEDRKDRRYPRAFVKLLDDQFSEEVEAMTIEQLPNEEMRRMHYAHDEGFPPVEGCKLANVGWLKMSARNLVPRGYRVLMNNGWPGVYVRPPGLTGE